MGKAKRELLRKRKNKFKREALNRWRPIVKKYDLRVDDSFLDTPAAEQYGWAKAERGFLGFIANLFFGNPLQQILVVLSVVLAIVSYGTTSWLTYVIIAASVTSYIVNTAYAQQIYLKQMAAWRNNAAAYATKSISEAEAERGRQSETITRDMIYGGYAIYANGAIYKDQFAGFNNNHSSQIAPDAAKGQFGTYKGSFIDDKLQNRSQVELAAGTSFMPKMLNTGFPLAKGMDSEDMLTLTKEMYIARSLKTIQGFNELVKNEFGINTHDGYLNEAYETIKKKTIQPFEINLTQLDFLDKNKAYNRGMIRDFDTLILSDFEQENKGESQEITPETKDFYNTYAQKQKLPTIRNKAINYIDNIELLFSLIMNADFYEFVPVSDENKTQVDRIFKAQGITAVRGELVSVDRIKEIFKKAKEYFADFKKFENYVLSIVKQSVNYQCIGLDEMQVFHFAELESLKLSVFLTYQHFLFLKNEDLAIIKQFQNGVPRSNILKDEDIQQYFDGV